MTTGSDEIENFRSVDHIHAAALALDQFADRVAEGDALAMLAYATVAGVHIQWARLHIEFPSPTDRRTT